MAYSIQEKNFTEDKTLNWTVFNDAGDAEMGTWVIATFRWREHAQEYCDALNEREADKKKHKRLFDYFRPTRQAITKALKFISGHREVLVRLSYGFDLKKHEDEKRDVLDNLYTIETALIMANKE